MADIYEKPHKAMAHDLDCSWFKEPLGENCDCGTLLPPVIGEGDGGLDWLEYAPSKDTAK